MRRGIRQRNDAGHPGVSATTAVKFRPLVAQDENETCGASRAASSCSSKNSSCLKWNMPATMFAGTLSKGTFPLKFYRPDGSPWVVSPTGMGPSSEFTITLAPGRFVEVELPDNSPNITTGWAEIQQPRDPSGGGTDIGGQAIFTDTSPTQPNRPDFEAVVPLSSFADSAFFLPFDNTGGLVTCAAFANPSELITNTVTLDFRDENDNSILLDTLMLGPKNQTAFCFPDRSPQLDFESCNISMTGLAKIVDGGRSPPLSNPSTREVDKFWWWNRACFTSR